MSKLADRWEAEGYGDHVRSERGSLTDEDGIDGPFDRAMAAAERADARRHKRLTRIPVIRATMAEIEATERAVIAEFKALHGSQHEPSAMDVREAAMKLLDKEQP